MSHLMDSDEALEDVRWAEPGNEGEIRVDCRLNCFACGILPTFANMRRDNPGDVWKCPDVKSPAGSNQLSESSLKVPMVGD